MILQPFEGQIPQSIAAKFEEEGMDDNKRISLISEFGEKTIQDRSILTWAH